MSASFWWLIIALVAAIVLDIFLVRVALPWWRKRQAAIQQTLPHPSQAEIAPGKQFDIRPQLVQLARRIAGLWHNIWPPVVRLLQRIPMLALVGVVVGLAGATQFAFDATAADSTPIIYLLLFALTAATFLLAYREKQSPELRAADFTEAPLPVGEPTSFDSITTQPRRSFLFTAAVVVILYAALRARELESNLQAGLAWGVGVSLFLGACWPAGWRPGFSSWKTFLAEHRNDLALGALLFIFAAAVRLYDLSRPDAGIEQDAANFAIDAFRILDGEQIYLFGVKWFMNTPAVYGYLQALMMLIFGRNETGWAMLSVIQGVASIMFVFLLARRLFGTGVAFTAGILLSIAQHHLYYSRTGENNLVVPLFMTAFLYFLHRGLCSRRGLDFALAGVLFGVGMWWDYNNKSVQMYPILFAIMAYWVFRNFRFWRANALLFGLAVLGFIIVLIPVWSGYQHTGAIADDFSHGRFIFSNLDRVLGSYQTDSIAFAVARQVERIFFGMNHIGTGTWPSARPMMENIAPIFFFIGLAYSLWRWRDTGYGLMLAWFAAGLQGSIWSIDGPYAHRLVMVIVPAFMFAGIGLSKVMQLWSAALNWKPVYSATIVGAVLATIVYANLALYFNPAIYPPEWLHIKIVGQMIRDKIGDHDIYFVGEPWLGARHAAIQFYSQNQSLKVVDAADAPEVAPFKVPPSRPVFFIFVGGNYEELGKIQTLYPGGRVVVIDDPVHNVPEALKTYELTAAQASRPVP